VQRAIELAKARGAKRAMLLPMSVPSHCSLMHPAAERLRERLARVSVREPAIPVVNNVDVMTEQLPDRIREALVRQLYNPVRWVESVIALACRGVGQLIECGPGGVLAGLNKRITPEPKTVMARDAGTLRELAQGSRT
jgi:[acyl-carrier-protein] S-malonyltransferase